MKKEVLLPDLLQTISQATTNLVPVPDAVLDHHVPITTLNDCEMTLNIEGLWCRKSCITLFLNCELGILSLCVILFSNIQYDIR